MHPPELWLENRAPEALAMALQMQQGRILRISDEGGPLEIAAGPHSEGMDITQTADIPPFQNYGKDPCPTWPRARKTLE